MALHQVGARTEGDVYQGLFFWRQAADLLRPNSLVERVVLEHDAADGVDDVAVFYRAPGVNARGWQASADYFQLKYHAEGQPRGFRPNALGWWHRDRYGKFADAVALEHLFTDNWNAARLQARGRLPNAVRDCNIALLGVGALGSVLAEMLVRAGVEKIALIDDDVLEAGNVTRHVATLVDVGEVKVPVVARRLRQISPTVRVAEFSEKLPSDAKAIETQLADYDIIIDCTSSDVALATLERAWWSIPRTFASFSMGFGGKRLFSFGLSGNRFPRGEFDRSVRPWLEYESHAWSDTNEVIEGAGCWSPLFPARYDDVALAAAVCVKELETLVTKRPTEPHFRVFAQESSDNGFHGFAPENTPPALEALAS